MRAFRFSDYNCIGFDLNHTLVSYDIENLIQLRYSVLSKFMMKRKAWDSKYLDAPLRRGDLDFLQKGLVVDPEKGNLLKLSGDGVILKASHGTRLLCQKEIEKDYFGGRWCSPNLLVDDPLGYSHGELPMDKCSVLDYFDMAALLVYARGVDSQADYGPYADVGLWDDILHGLAAVFKEANFATDQGEYFPELKKNPEMYINKCSPETLAWMRQVKETKMTFLVTNSQADYTDFVARYALGNDWRLLFDIVVCNAQKPQFFTKRKPFFRLSGDDEDIVEEPAALTRGEIYSRGNWRGLYKFFWEIMDKSPKCLYVGDNLIQDVYGAGSQSTCDAVVLSNELRCESKRIYDFSTFLCRKITNSQFWGSYFCHTKDNRPVKTLWCTMIEEYSKICVASMETIASHELKHLYECFDKTCDADDGFYPAKPRDLLSV